MATKLYDLVKAYCSTTGTGSLILGDAVPGFLSFAGGGVSNGDTVRYCVRDGASTEMGWGVYSSTGPTLTRNVTKSTNSNNPISLSGASIVFITVSKDDIQTQQLANLGTPASGSVALFALASVVPQMTSNTSAGAVASASSNYYSTPPWQAFTNDRTQTTGWITDWSQSGWLKLQLPAAKVVYGYGIVGWSPDAWSGRCPKSWTFEGSNDGSTWTVLDTRTNLNQETWWRWGERFFPVASPASYLYYRLNITANYGDGYMGVSNLALYGEADPPAKGWVGLFMRTPAGEIVRVSPNGVYI